MKRRMGRRGKALALLIGAGMILAGAGGAGSPVQADGVSCGGAWQSVSGANLGAAFRDYGGVAATGPNDAWLVGEYAATRRENHALIEHWDGLRWIQMPSPAGSQASRLNGVAVIAPNDAWAVGYSFTSEVAAGETLIAHWDGNGWTRVPAPRRPGDSLNMLFGVAATGSADVWAVGYVTNSQAQTHDPRVLHWDGVRWSEVALPDLGANVFLNAVVAPRPDDVWVAGGSGLLGEGGPVIAHWDGHTWSRRADAGDQGYFQGIGGAAPDDLWAVGTIETPPSSAQRQGVIRHWNGSAWTAVPNPIAPTTGSELFGIAAPAPHDVWIVGDLGHASADPPPLQTLTLHWDGGRWAQVATDPSPIDGYHFAAVAAGGQGTLWAVGDSKIARYTDPCAPPGPPPGNPDVSYFPQTGHTLRGGFRAYWQAHGGLTQFGYPLTEEFPEVSPTDGKTYTVQYFERNRFEYHPEHAGTPSEVLLGLLGQALTADRGYEAAFQPAAQAATGMWFPQTQHNLAPEFVAYWQAHGGLPVYGYPISEAFTEISRTDGKPYLVQYFERNRFELHPELPAPFRVSLGLLGVQVLQARGWVP